MGSLGDLAVESLVSNLERNNIDLKDASSYNLQQVEAAFSQIFGQETTALLMERIRTELERLAVDGADIPSERGQTQTCHSHTEATNAILEFFSAASNNIDMCIDSPGPSYGRQSEPIKKGTMEVIDRGVKMRFITQITKDNLDICKDMSRIMEMRHMDGLKGGFGVHDLQYLAIAIMHNSKDEEPQIQVIKSNVKSIIEHQQQVFNDLWNSALPAQDKIKEMGIEVIDRLYVCEDCESSFVFREEMKFHEESTGHKNICEFLL